MEDKVVLISYAKAQFKETIHYLLYELESQQTATNVTNDFEATIIWLSSGLVLLGCVKTNSCGFGATEQFTSENIDIDGLIVQK